MSGHGRGKGRSGDKRPTDAWGPPLGAPRGKQNQPHAASAAPSAWGPPAQASGQSAWGPSPSSGGRGHGQPQPPPSQPAAQSAWGQPRAEGSSSSGNVRSHGQPQPQPSQPAAQSAWGQPRTGASSSSGDGRLRGQQQTPSTQPAPPSARHQPPPQASAASGHREERPQSACASSSSCGSSKRSTEESSSQRSKYHADSSRGARGAVHGADRERKERAVETIVKSRPENMNSKIGTEGTEISLVTNYFRTQGPRWILYTYCVEFRPEIEDKLIKQRLLREHRTLFNGYLFEGMRIFTPTRLEILNNTLDLVSRRHEGDEVSLVIKFTGELSMQDNSSLQVFNLIVRRAMGGLNLKLVGRDYFDPAARKDIRQHNIQLWPGYLTSIRQHERDILMCVEITTKLMRTETVLEILSRTESNSKEWKIVFFNTVVGSTVLTNYNNCTYRINDIDWKSNPLSTFDTKDGPTSYVDYYKQRYGITIRDLTQPMLISKPKAKDIRGGNDKLIVLVPELCCATGFTDEMRKNFRLMADVGRYTRVEPADRIQRLLQFNNRLTNTPKSMATFSDWNMQLSPDLVEVRGRKFANEKIVFSANSGASDQNADWTYLLRNAQIYQQPTCRVNVWFVITTAANLKDTEFFMRGLHTVARNMGFDIGQMNSQRMRVIKDERVMSYINEVEKCAQSNPQFIICVVSNDNADRYSAIKRKCCVDRAIPSQCIKVKTMLKKGLAVATKVAIQILCKLGGAPWSIDMPLSKIMVIGYDVCHDTRDKSRSFGAMVATMDMKRHSKFFSAVTPHTNGEELSNDLSLNIVKALHEFRTIEGGLPERILIYRDGVGEGQTQYVYEHEVANIREKLEPIYKKENKAVKLAFIIVSKRINTRIFENRRHNPTNPPPGTVVDDVITLPERYDFYLISQHVNQGSASPTSYNVFDYSFGLPPGKLQLLTYKMCHLYYNWTGTTRVPAVCQYAHKLAFLCGQFIHQSPVPTLEKLLYFL